MTARAIDPNNGWAFEDGRWVWADGVNIEDGTVQGQITTWDVAEKEWTPDSSLTIDASGDATFSGTVNAGQAIIETGNYLSAGGVVFRNSTGGGGVMITNSGGQFVPIVDNTINFGASGRTWKDAYFSGTVDAAGFTVNGQPISGGGDLGAGFVLENENAPTNNKKLAMKVETSGALRIQALNDAGGGGGSYFEFNRNGNSVTRLSCNRNGSPVGYWDVDTNTITAADFVASSDERLKDNITTVPVGLVDSLKGREWEWKESGEKGSGVVAQELEQVLPHLVHEDDDGVKSVSYMGLCAYLIEELKDCRERLAVLEAKE